MKVETSQPSIAGPEQVSPVDYLLSAGKLLPEALDRARRGAAEAEEAIEATLCKLGLVSERDMAEAFSRTLGLPIVDTAQIAQSDIPATGASLSHLASLTTAKEYRTAPEAAELTVR